MDPEIGKKQEKAKPEILEAESRETGSGGAKSERFMEVIELDPEDVYTDRKKMFRFKRFMMVNGQGLKFIYGPLGVIWVIFWGVIVPDAPWLVYIGVISWLVGAVFLENSSK